ncbi:MAG: peptidase M24 family protein, partial [Actinobacteria bacterium]|nr:peptidase M24 family protein [Actinomycetota bacterium]
QHFLGRGRLGYSTSLGASSTSRQWWFAGGQKNLDTDEQLVVFNPTSRDQSVSVAFLTGTTDEIFREPLVLTIPAGRVTTLATSKLPAITDGRYGEQARFQLATSGAAARVFEARSAAALREGVEQSLTNATHVAVDPNEVTQAQFETLRTQTTATMVPTVGVVQHLRRRKTEAEIARMRRAAACTDAALAECVEMMRHRPTERDVRDELEYRMRRHGADGPSYDTIVATGPNGARPHHRPTSTVIESGHSVVIDVGALVDGYHSDMTRTYLIGEVDPVMRQMHDVVRESQLAGLAAVRAGVTAGDVDKVCRDIIADAGMADLFIHSTGHGVGLQIHEQPWVRTAMSEPLQAGEVVTVEPGVYREGLGGVRIEDLVVVTESGCNILTESEKDLSCLQLAPTN